MATGDILSFIIDASGWMATVKVEGLGTGGTYDFGLGTNNDPTSAKIELSLTSQGYSTSGVLGTTGRTIYGVPCVQPDVGAMRKAYPDQTDPNETISGSDVDIVIALSEYIYSADTAVTVDFLSGWYTQGTVSNSVSGLSVTNNSTETYPLPVGNWAYPGYSKVTGDFDVEVTAFHKFDVAAVKISATDGATTVSEYVTDLTVSSKNDYNSVLVYESTIDTSGLNDGVITVDFIIYPVVGNASSLLDSSDAVNTWPTPLYTSQKYRLDTGSDHGYTVVDATNGNDGAGAVYSSQVLAEAGSAFQTIPAALTAMQTYNNTNASHNDAGGGMFLLPEDSIELDTNNGGTATEWAVFKPISTADPANVSITVSTSLSAIPPMVKIENCIVSGGGYITASNTDSIWFDRVDMQMSGTLTVYKTLASFATHCTGFFEREFNQFSTNITVWAIVRGCNFALQHGSEGSYTVLGNRNVNMRDRINTAIPLKNNCIWAFNYIDHLTDSLQVSLGGSYDLDGFAMVQNVMVRYGTQTAPFVQISADSSTTTTNNVIIWHNSVIGARANLGYNDIGSGGPYAQLNWSMLNNIWSNWNNKDDTFGPNASATGGWPVGYGVGTLGDFRRTSAADEWRGEFQGIGANWGTNATPLEPLYVEDNSADGINTSGGDYHLQETSPARGLIQRQVLPFDLDGRVRLVDGSVGALEYYDLAPIASQIYRRFLGGLS